MSFFHTVGGNPPTLLPPASRMFFALLPPPEVRAGLLEVQARLRSSLHGTGARVRWIRPEGLHITLAFLGEIP